MPQLYDQFHGGENTPPRRTGPAGSGYPMTPSPLGRRPHRERRRALSLAPVLLILLVLAAVLTLVLWGPSDAPPDPSGAVSAPPAASDALATAGPTPAGPDGSAAPTPNNLRDITAPPWITQEFLPLNEWSRPGDPLPQVNGVVIHYVGNPGTTAEQNRSYFERLAENHEAYASSHFLVGLDGEVIQCVPLSEISYCSTVRNADTIAIECCHPDAEGKFTEETMASLVKLVDWLIETYDLGREDVIRHYDVAGKECPIYYVRNLDAWEDFLDRLTFPDP